MYSSLLPAVQWRGKDPWVTCLQTKVIGYEWRPGLQLGPVQYLQVIALLCNSLRRATIANIWTSQSIHLSPWKWLEHLLEKLAIEKRRKDFVCLQGIWKGFFEKTGYEVSSPPPDSTPLKLAKVSLIWSTEICLPVKTTSECTTQPQPVPSATHKTVQLSHGGLELNLHWPTHIHLRLTHSYQALISVQPASRGGGGGGGGNMWPLWPRTQIMFYLPHLAMRAAAWVGPNMLYITSLRVYLPSSLCLNSEGVKLKMFSCRTNTHTHTTHTHSN